MARVKSICRAHHMVVNGPTDAAASAIRATGWQVKVDRTVEWAAHAASPSCARVRVVLCGPDAAAFRIVHRLTAGGGVRTNVCRWQPDGEEYFLYAEYRDGLGNWVPMDGDDAVSGVVLTGDGDACNFYWSSPVDCILTLESETSLPRPPRQPAARRWPGDRR